MIATAIAAPVAGVIYARPVLIQAVPTYVGGPIYLHVPPGHEKHWSKHCAKYNACGRPVYFVREDWYNREYVPRQHHSDTQKDKDHGHGQSHDHGQGHDQDD